MASGAIPRAGAMTEHNRSSKYPQEIDAAYAFRLMLSAEASIAAIRERGGAATADSLEERLQSIKTAMWELSREAFFASKTEESDGQR